MPPEGFCQTSGGLSISARCLKALRHHVSKHNRGHCLHNNRCTQGKARIMTARHRKPSHNPSLDISSQLCLADARSRLESHTEHNRSTAGQASVNSACTIFQRNAVTSQRVIMLRTFHAGSGKTISELHATHSRDREYGMRNH